MILSPIPEAISPRKAVRKLKGLDFLRDTPPKTNMTMEKRTIWRCISTTKNGDVPASHVSFSANYINIPWSELWRFSSFRGNPPGSEEETFKTTEQTRFRCLPRHQRTWGDITLWIQEYPRITRQSTRMELFNPQLLGPQTSTRGVGKFSNTNHGGFAISSLETTLKNWRNPELPRVSKPGNL